MPAQPTSRLADQGKRSLRPLSGVFRSYPYYRFPLSFREVEEMMLARGVTVSHDTIRQWTGKFGQAYATGLRRRRPHPGDTWHLDEVFIKINGKTHYLWRAVDQDGNVLDILVGCADAVDGTC